jgi:AcrR family transcriptional regulator
MTTYHHGDLREAILEAAGRMIEKEGLAGLSVREAARRAGVSHTAPYRHFPDRKALLAALAAEGFSQLAKVLENRSGRELAEAYVRFALEHPQRFRLMFASGRAHADLRAQFGAAFSELGAGASLAAAAAWALVHGLAQLALDGHLESNEAFVSNVLSAVRFAQRSA